MTDEERIRLACEYHFRETGQRIDPAACFVKADDQLGAIVVMETVIGDTRIVSGFSPFGVSEPWPEGPVVDSTHKLIKLDPGAHP